MLPIVVDMHVSLLVLIIILLGIFSRLIPHAPNIAAIGAKKYLPAKMSSALV